jgi:hypothetical protein
MAKEQDKSVSYVVEQNKLISKQEGSLFGDYTRWTTKEVVRLLEKFCKSPEGANAKISLAVPHGFGANQTSFDIKRIDLVPNTIVGAKEKYRLIIVVQ